MSKYVQQAALASNAFVRDDLIVAFTTRGKVNTKVVSISGEMVTGANGKSYHFEQCRKLLLREAKKYFMTKAVDTGEIIDVFASKSAAEDAIDDGEEVVEVLEVLA